MSKKNKEKVAVADENINQEEKTSNEQELENNPMDVLKEEVEKEKDRYLRLFAEFENYKKRTGKERLELFKTAGQDVMVSLLPVLDDFDRALKEIEKSENDTLFKGVELISNKLNETLRQKGLEAIKTEAGENFNADIHEAITQIPAPSEDMKGKIIDVIEKGYSLGEKIIRYPKVVIGN
ncbi:MAG: nucleotide exchange factor GrpE [Flavobacteriaceae bacterium]